MDPIIISIIIVVIFLALLSLGMHVGISLIIPGFLGMVMLRGIGPAISELATVSWTSSTSFTLAVIPMFMLMGNVATKAGITSDLFKACYRWLGRFRGGLALVAIGTSSLFHCFCGSATATAATIGAICYPEMLKYNYEPRASAGIIASASAFGLLIPPGIGYILYSTMSGVSIGKMFAGGIGPTVFMIFASFIVIAYMVWRKPESMPRGEKFTMREKLSSLKGIVAFVVLFVFMLWGIFTGFFSPSEGGSIGAAGALIIMIFKRRFSFKVLWECLRDSVKMSVMIFLIMIGANIFGATLAMTQMPRQLAEVLSSMDTSPYVVLWIIMAVYFILGMAIDTLPLIAVLTPIFMPVVTKMGWDPVWFGVLTVMCMVIGLISPPDGMPVYVMAGISKQPLMKVFGACLPFFIMNILALIVLVYVQPITTWFVNLVHVY